MQRLFQAAEKVGVWRHRRRRGIAGLWMALGLASCGPGHSERVPLYRASGTVLYEGELAAGVELRLYPEPARRDGLTPLGRTNEDGTFALMTYEGEDGAPPGRYAIGLRWPEAESNGRPGPKPDRLKEKYRDPAKTIWRVTITEGENILDPLEIPAVGAKVNIGKKSKAMSRSSKPPISHDGPISHHERKAIGP